MAHFTLFYNDYSICSIMVRFTLAVARQYHEGQIDIEQKYIDIQHGGQLAEEYLCEVNPKGTVPVLHRSNPNSTAGASTSTSPDASLTLTESLDITHLLASQSFFPGLSPPHLTEQIKSLLVELHKINYFSLTYTNKPQRAIDMEVAVFSVLENEGISERYRKALAFKLDVIRATRAPALTKEAVVAEEQKAESLLSKIESLLSVSKTSSSDKTTTDTDHSQLWIFGTPQPTALDAHVVPFLARLLDVGRREMLAGKNHLLAYAEGAFQTQAWHEVMQGRKTVYVSYL